MIDEGLITTQQAVGLLERYKKHRVSEYPFVAIPPTENLQSLRTKAPILLLAILTVCLEDDHPLQVKLATTFKETLCKSLIMDDEKSLGTLQGLLVYLTFYHGQCQPQQQVYLFRQMAIALCGDLGLDRRPCPDPQMGLNTVERPYTSGVVVDDGRPESWAAAKNRAFLGCFYSSSSSLLFRRHATIMPSTKYVLCGTRYAISITLDFVISMNLFL